jgi:hypothetical protein
MLEMKLREQVLDIARRRINPQFAEKVNFPQVVTALTEIAFRERWDEQAVEVRARQLSGRFVLDSAMQVILDANVLHRAVELMHLLGGISNEEPGVC